LGRFRRERLLVVRILEARHGVIPLPDVSKRVRSSGSIISCDFSQYRRREE